MAEDTGSETIVTSTTMEGPLTQLLYPQNQLVSVKLTETNFLIWKTQVFTAIKGYGLEKFVDPVPSVPDQFILNESQNQVLNPAYTLWVRQDQILASWILSSLSESILPLMIGLNSSCEIWSVLEKNFASQSKAKMLQYKLQLQTTKKGNLSIREYLAKIKMCCDLLATTGNIVSEEDQIMHVLSGLGPEYDPVVVTVTAGNSSFGINDVRALLLTFEARLESAMNLNNAGMINSDGSQPTANYVTQENNQRRGFNPRGRGSYSYRGRGGRNSYRGRGGRTQGARVTCQVCHTPGHTADRCWYRFDHSYGSNPNNNSNVTGNGSNKNPTLNMAHLPPNRNIGYSEEGCWFPDSGASSHVTNDLNAMHSVSEYSGSNKLQMGNGNNESISHIGNAILHTTDRNKCFYLNDLLHVPGITRNLISVSKFALDNNVYFEFHPLFCLVKDLATQETLLKGMLKDGLYQFNLDHVAASRNKDVSVHNVFTASTVLDIKLWHKRLGHSSYEIVKRSLRSGNISFKSNDDSSICSSCMLAKSHKLPFAASDNVSTAPFDLVHTDLWGPAPVESVNEYRYYVSYIDDHTKYTWIYLLKLKSEVSTTFIHFHNMVETQFQARIKSVQSDGGTEYKPLNEFFKAKGILHRISCAYTPQQNGCAERKHRHVVEMGLSLLAESNMPLKYWDDAFTTATYLINRVPAKGIEFVSPYEKLTKQRPDYTSLKVFGCLCYPYTRPYNKHKLEYRSQPGVFIGYSLQYKGYKVLLPSGKVIITRHVIFEESVFPFSKVENQDQQKQVLTPVFASSEPTVATFPKFLSQNNHNVTPENENLLQTPCSSQHS